MKHLLLVFAMLPWFLTAQAQHDATITNVGSERFKEVMDSLSDEVVVDLRTPDELTQGKIPGAIVIDYFGRDFEPAIKGLDKNKTYLLYCAGGGRSGETAELMSKLGFKTIYNLEEGFTGWKKKKMPIAKAE